MQKFLNIADKMSFRRTSRFYLFSFIRHDLKAGITVFFIALPLCLGISLASGTPVISGILSGIIGGLVVSLISRSPLSVSGPAAGLTALSAAAITQLGDLSLFFLSVAIAGVFQIIMGGLRISGFTYFIPSAVIKGMLAAIGVLLMIKQVPLLLGYDRPDFWSKELFNLLSFRHGFERINNWLQHFSIGVCLVSAVSFALLAGWKRWLAARWPFIPASFITVLVAVLLTLALSSGGPEWRLRPEHYVHISAAGMLHFSLPDVSALYRSPLLWHYGLLIGFVASLETLLSVEAVDKMDPFNRITPQHRELIAQGTGNVVSGLIGGLPITAVIVRSSANVEAGGRTRLSAISHGTWLLLMTMFAVPLLNRLPYCVLAVLLVRTGYQLARPAIFKTMFRQGREQFLPFAVTIAAVLLTDLLIGVLIGMTYAIYFLIKHTYRAGFTVTKRPEGHHLHYQIDLAQNVSFLNKKKIADLLDRMPQYSIVEINGRHSVYIDHDVLEIIYAFQPKARRKHIELHLINLPEPGLQSGSVSH